MEENQSKFLEDHDSVEMQAYNQIMITNTMLDCRMAALKGDIACKQEEVERVEEEISADAESIERLNKELASVRDRDAKSAKTIDSYRTSKLMVQGLEISLSHRLQGARERNKDLKKNHQQILAKYNSIWETYKETYNRLPKIKERNGLKLKLSRLIITVNMEKREMEIFTQKLGLFRKITDSRVRATTVCFARTMKERDEILETIKHLEECNRDLRNEIGSLRSEKSQLLNRASEKARLCVANAHERSVRYRAGLSTFPMTTLSQSERPIAPRIPVAETMSSSQPETSRFALSSSTPLKERALGMKFALPEESRLPPTKKPNTERKMFRMSEPPPVLQKLLESPILSRPVRKVVSSPSPSQEMKAESKHKTMAEPREAKGLEGDKAIAEKTAEKEEESLERVVEKLGKELGGEITNDLIPGVPAIRITFQTKRNVGFVDDSVHITETPKEEEKAKLSTKETTAERGPESPKVFLSTSSCSNLSFSPGRVDELSKDSISARSPESIFKHPPRIKSSKQEGDEGRLYSSPDLEAGESSPVPSEEFRVKSQLLSDVVDSPLYSFDGENVSEKVDISPFSVVESRKRSPPRSPDFGSFLFSGTSDEGKKKKSSTNSFFQLF